MIVRRAIINQRKLINNLAELRFKKEKNIAIVCDLGFAQHLFGGYEIIIENTIRSGDTVVIAKLDNKYILDNAKYEDGQFKTVQYDVVIVTNGEEMTAEDFESLQAGKELVIYQENNTNEHEYARYALSMEFGER